jgi:hypothetical protein
MFSFLRKLILSNGTLVLCGLALIAFFIYWVWGPDHNPHAKQWKVITSKHRTVEEIIATPIDYITSYPGPDPDFKSAIIPIEGSK